jgi:hypothetical protein
MNPLTLFAKHTEHFHGTPTRRAEPVRISSIKFRRLAGLHHYVVLAQDQPYRAR